LSSVTATVPSSVNNYSPSGYTVGVTNRLVLTPASGGSTITGLSAGGVPDGWQVTVVNASASDSVTFANQSGSSTTANQFFCPGAGNAVLGVQYSVVIEYVASLNAWVFL